MSTDLACTTTQTATIDGHKVEHIHTVVYDGVMLNNNLLFIDSNVPSVALVYQAVCKGLRAKTPHAWTTPVHEERG